MQKQNANRSSSQTSNTKTSDKTGLITAHGKFRNITVNSPSYNISGNTIAIVDSSGNKSVLSQADWNVLIKTVQSLNSGFTDLSSTTIGSQNSGK